MHMPPTQTPLSNPTLKPTSQTQLSNPHSRTLLSLLGTCRSPPYSHPALIACHLPAARTVLPAYEAPGGPGGGCCFLPFFLFLLIGGLLFLLPGGLLFLLPGGCFLPFFFFLDPDPDPDPAPVPPDPVAATQGEGGGAGLGGLRGCGCQATPITPLVAMKVGSSYVICGNIQAGWW